LATSPEPSAPLCGYTADRLLSSKRHRFAHVGPSRVVPSAADQLPPKRTAPLCGASRWGWVGSRLPFGIGRLESAALRFPEPSLVPLEDLAARGLLQEALPVVEQLDQCATELARLAGGLTIETLRKQAEATDDPNRAAGP
jgi:hypothetical protein